MQEKKRNIKRIYDDIQKKKKADAQAAERQRLDEALQAEDQARERLLQQHLQDQQEMDERERELVAAVAAEFEAQGGEEGARALRSAGPVDVAMEDPPVVHERKKGRPKRRDAPTRRMPDTEFQTLLNAMVGPEDDAAPDFVRRLFLNQQTLAACLKDINIQMKYRNEVSKNVSFNHVLFTCNGTMYSIIILSSLGNSPREKRVEQVLS